MLDLNTLDVAAAADRAVRVELESPKDGETLRDDAGQAFYVDILGEDSADVRRIDRRHADRRNEAIRKRGTLHLDQATIEAEAIERLVVATTGWHLPPIDGEMMSFTPANARAVYSRPGFVWIVEQLGRAMKDRRRFFETPSTS